MDNSDLLQYMYPVSSDTHVYGRLRTIWAASFYLLLCGIFELSLLLISFNWPSNAVQCDPLYILLYCHVSFWFITLILDHYFKWTHHMLYLKGFLEFSEEIKKLASIPFLIVSLWNAVLLAVVTFYHQYNTELEPACHKTDLYSPVVGAVILFTIEVIVIYIIIIKYIRKVYTFNLEKCLPDVHNNSRLAPMHSFVADEVGFKEEVNGLEELLEKQADLIKFFRNENEVLNKKILYLNCQLRGETIN